ncbi:hypothetical protein [Pseudomonas japonica]|nr:hypothetical protein [Pseudomonas japonica]
MLAYLYPLRLRTALPQRQAGQAEHLTFDPAPEGFDHPAVQPR